MSDKPDFELNNEVASGQFFNYPDFSQKSSVTSYEDYLDPSRSVSHADKESTMPEYLVAFSGRSKNYCIGLVDMVNSTKILAGLNQTKGSRYYQVFLNSMSRILGRFGGYVIKSVGDCLLYYFPESSKPLRKYGFMSCLEGSLAMVEARDIICEQLHKEGLPCVDYRISADYGSVILMNTNNSSIIDIVGPPVNMCSKINHSASKNGVVIGGDLYELVKNFDDYIFRETKGYSVGFKYPYPVYFVIRREK